MSQSTHTSKAVRVTPGEHDPGPVSLHARNVAFDFESTPLHWIPGHPMSSNVISMLNLLLPEGERWFIDVFKQALPLVRDETLHEDVLGFIGQEVTHGNEHERCVERMRAHGIRFDRELALFETGRRLLERRVRSLPGPLRRQADRYKTKGQAPTVDKVIDKGTGLAT